MGIRVASRGRLSAACPVSLGPKGLGSVTLPANHPYCMDTAPIAWTRRDDRRRVDRAPQDTNDSVEFDGSQGA